MKAKTGPAAATLAAAVDLISTSTVTGRSLAHEFTTGSALIFDYGAHGMWLPLDEIDEIWLRYWLETRAGVLVDRHTMHDAVQLVCSKKGIDPFKELPR